MGKRNRRSRAEILAKREATRAEPVRTAPHASAHYRGDADVTETVLGGEPLETAPADVQRLVEQLHVLEVELLARGWTYSALSELGSAEWLFPPAPNHEISVVVDYTDDDYEPVAADHWSATVIRQQLPDEGVEDWSPTLDPYEMTEHRMSVADFRERLDSIESGAFFDTVDR